MCNIRIGDETCKVVSLSSSLFASFLLAGVSLFLIAFNSYSRCNLFLYLHFSLSPSVICLTDTSRRSMKLDREPTSVKVSKDSQYALMNHSPDVSNIPRLFIPPLTPSCFTASTSFRLVWLRHRLIQEIRLWDIQLNRLAREFTGRHILRSCFGGIDEGFVISGSKGAHSFFFFFNKLN
jgi:hypothetical protein